MYDILYDSFFSFFRKDHKMYLKILENLPKPYNPIEK